MPHMGYTILQGSMCNYLYICIYYTIFNTPPQIYDTALYMGYVASLKTLLRKTQWDKNLVKEKSATRIMLPLNSANVFQSSKSDPV